MNPKVSIIIPCYNVENYVEECVESAFNQSYTAIEVICIDNNSIDSTLQKLEKLKSEYPQLIIDRETKPGAPAARNRGLLLSRGEWLQFLDADDLLMPTKIEHQIELLKNTADVSFVAGACFRRDLAGNSTLDIPDSGNPFKSLFVTRLGNTCSNLWNRKEMKKIKGWDESLKSSQEADLMFRLLQQNPNAVIDNTPLTVIRTRPSGQISQGNHAENWRRYFEKRVEMAEWHKKNNPDFYSCEKQFFNDALFGILKIIASEDLETACYLYKKQMNGVYKASQTQAHSTKIYLILVRLFGFRGAEMVKRIIGKTVLRNMG
ncbi:MAG: glycosyltransferase family 2 protein [Bacteroidales bacterium]|jgi:glycosyltransferase involved in cell wall biosynthesis|nr:glycosyltransferase family 2 protein [Bacteroidales bacterium]